MGGQPMINNVKKGEDLLGNEETCNNNEKAGVMVYG